MKTIIAPTDFSEAADNAVNYAAEIANVTGAKLILFHSYHPPLVTSDMPVALPSLDEIELAALTSLRKTGLAIRNKFNNRFAIESIVKCGFAADETEQLSNETHADIIVMGMRGAGFIEEKLIGSVTTSVLNSIKIPLLIIDSKLKFEPLKNIALATDLEETNNQKMLHIVKYFANLFKAKIHLINVILEPQRIPSVEEAVAGVKLSSALQNFDHDFVTIESENVVEGINEYVKNHKIDLVVMMPRKHSLFTRIFSSSVTKHMAFHALTPLMCIHE